MDVGRFRVLLLEREAELVREIAAGKEGAQAVELDQSSVGRLSRMDALQSQALGAEAQRRRELGLSKVRSALKRLEDDVYGGCLGCGEPIAERRLEHDPAATLCVDCARSR